MLEKINNVKGQERPDMLPMWTLPASAPIGAAVVGAYAGSDTFQVDEKDEQGTVTGKRTVRYIKLAGVLQFTPLGDNHEKGETVQHLALGVPLNADTKNKLDPDTLPPTCYILVQYKGKDAQFNNMRRFRVEIISKAAYLDLLNASAGE